jgi:hypothetical protein
VARLRLPGGAALAAFAALLVAASSPAHHIKEGGTFRVGIFGLSDILGASKVLAGKAQGAFGASRRRVTRSSSG